MSEKIAILGAGAFGQALGHLLIKPGHTVTFWDVDTKKLNHGKTCDQVVQEADIIFFAVPSWCLRESIGMVLPCVKPEAVFVSVSKGIEKKTCATTDQIFSEEINGDRAVAYLSGPMLAAEIVQDKPTGALIASKDIAIAKRIGGLFTNTGLRTVTSTDVRGVALCGVLKNIYTIGMGMAHALRLGDNAKGFILSQAIHEMVAIAVKLGGTKETMFGAAGLGDLITTSAGMYSRNFTFGYTFVRSSDGQVTAEGAKSFLQLQQMIGDTTPYPLLDQLIEVLERKITPQQFFTRYFAS